MLGKELASKRLEHLGTLLPVAKSILQYVEGYTQQITDGSETSLCLTRTESRV